MFDNNDFSLDSLIENNVVLIIDEKNNYGTVV